MRETIREFIRRGGVIKTVINAMTFNGATKDPVQQAVRDALIAFMAATAQAQAEATKAAQRAGIEQTIRRAVQRCLRLGRRGGPHRIGYGVPIGSVVREAHPLSRANP